MKGPNHSCTNRRLQVTPHLTSHLSSPCLRCPTKPSHLEIDLPVRDRCSEQHICAKSLAAVAAPKKMWRGSSLGKIEDSFRKFVCTKIWAGVCMLGKHIEENMVLCEPADENSGMEANGKNGICQSSQPG